jgi:hypothetical protein
MYKSRDYPHSIAVRLTNRGASQGEAIEAGRKLTYGNGREFEEIFVSNPDKSLIEYCEELMRYSPRILADTGRQIP